MYPTSKPKSKEPDIDNPFRIVTSERWYTINKLVWLPSFEVVISDPGTMQMKASNGCIMRAQ